MPSALSVQFHCEQTIQSLEMNLLHGLDTWLLTCCLAINTEQLRLMGVSLVL